MGGRSSAGRLPGSGKSKLRGAASQRLSHKLYEAAVRGRYLKKARKENQNAPSIVARWPAVIAARVPTSQILFLFAARGSMS